MAKTKLAPLANPDAFTRHRIATYRDMGWPDHRIAVELRLRTPEQYEYWGLSPVALGKSSLPPVAAPAKKERAQTMIAQRLERLRLARAEFERRVAARLPTSFKALAEAAGADPGYFWYRLNVAEDPSVAALKRQVDLHNQSLGGKP